MKRTIRGRAAKQKGSRAEIKVRNMLRSIYPVELRDRVYRVPLSGGGAIKGDVCDNNDYDSCYEVKNQETLVLNDWWRQAKSQAGVTRTPVLVITQSYRPFYFILHKKDWDAMVAATEYNKYTEREEYKGSKNLMDRLAELGLRVTAGLHLDDDDCTIVSQTFYLEVKKSLFENS